MASKKDPTPSGAVKTLAARLKEVRRFRGRTQENVAEQLKVNYRHLQKIEGGKADFKLSTLTRLAALFEIEPCFLANTHSNDLFRTLGLPCHSLLLDALPAGLLILDQNDAVAYRNRRGKELLEYAKGGVEGMALARELAARAKELSAGKPSAYWNLRIEDNRGGALELGIEGVLQGCESRQALFLIQAADTSFRAEPIGLARFKWEAFLDVPAKNIRTYRRAKKLTQSEAAESLEMNLRYYQKIESGRLDLKTSTLDKIAKSYGVKPCQLLVDEALRPPCAGSVPCTASLLESLPFGVLAVSARGEIAYANATFFRMLDLEWDPATQKHYWEIEKDPAEREQSKKFFDEIFAKRPAPSPLFREVTYRDGTRTRLTSNWNYLYSAKGELLGGVSIVSKAQPGNS